MGSNNLPPDEPDEVLTGEIIPAGHMSEQEYQKRRRGRGTGWRTHLLDEDDMKEIVRLSVAEVPLREIAQRFNVSHETIRRWTGDYVGKVAKRSVDIAQIRAEQAAQLEVARAEAWKMFHTAKHPATKRDALTRVESLTRSIADLLGAKVPVVLKAEVTVTEVDPADIKLREMINEAQAKAAATRADVERQFKGGA